MDLFPFSLHMSSDGLFNSSFLGINQYIGAIQTNQDLADTSKEKTVKHK